MTHEDFIKMIDIEHQESTGTMGHFPFQGFIIDADDKATMLSLILPDIQSVYAALLSGLQEHPGATKVYFSADFPAMHEIKTDFVCCCFWEKTEGWSGVLLPYTSDGEILPIITETPTLTNILNQTSFCMAMR